MSIQKIINCIKEQSMMASSSSNFVKIGKIINYSADSNYLVQVQLEELISADDDSFPALQTWWTQIISLWVGNGWGLFCSPTLGANCVIFFQDVTYQAPIGAFPF